MLPFRTDGGCSFLGKCVAKPEGSVKDFTSGYAYGGLFRSPWRFKEMHEMGVSLNLIVFHNENVNNEYTNFHKKLKPKIEYEYVTKKQKQALDGRHDEILKMVQQAVEDYINDDDLIFEDDNFPSRKVLTGNYYIRDEIYEAYEDGSISISIATAFTGILNNEETDYLGLEVCLEFDSINEILEFDGVNSSVIGLYDSEEFQNISRYKQFRFFQDTEPPASLEEIEQVEKQLSLVIPDIHKEFLMEYNGAHTECAFLYGLDSIVERYELCQMKEYAPGYICIGDNGGGYVLLMEAKADAKAVHLVSMGSIGIDMDDEVLSSIFEWLSSGDGDDPGDPLDLFEEDTDWHDMVDVALIKLPSNGLKGFLHLQNTLELPVSATHVYQQAKKSLPCVLLENVYRGIAERRVEQLEDPGIVQINERIIF